MHRSNQRGRVSLDHQIGSPGGGGTYAIAQVAGLAPASAAAVNGVAVVVSAALADWPAIVSYFIRL